MVQPPLGAEAPLGADLGGRGPPVLPAQVGESDSVGPEAAGDLRDQGARQRDVLAHRRDQAGSRRDIDAEMSDLRSDERRWAIHDGDGSERDDAETSAAADRNLSRLDRRAAADDRANAQHDRTSALADRNASALDRRYASVDGLTGVYAREAGIAELERELARAQRTGRSLVVAFVDVDHLKHVNDTDGHAAGDRMLRAVARALQSALRPYDLVIRYGGDEFLCAIEGVDLATARTRFERVNELLAQGPDRGSVTAGLATWQSGDSAAAVIDRADIDLYSRRRLRTDPLPRP